MTSKKYGPGLLWFFISFLVDEVISRQISDSKDDYSLNSVFSSTQAIVAICLSTFAFIIVIVIAIFKCADCYNSEVSTEFHPACNDTNRKWGGGVGYTSSNTGQASVSFGETVTPGGPAPLPYSMIPTSIPEQAGFQGYHSGDNVAASPLMGYQAASAPAPASEGPRNYNPMEQQLPPPAYSDALRQSSLRGYR